MAIRLKTAVKGVSLAIAGAVVGAVVLFALPGEPAKHIIPSAQASDQFSTGSDGCLAVFNHELRGLHTKNSHDLCELTKDKVVMVVNTASKCGYTGQFEGLEALYQRYKDEDFVILGFPSDSFMQEHNDEAETADVCFVNFGVTFPMMATTPVRGSDANPVFQALSAAAQQSPQWNFHKYIVAADGSQVSSFVSKVTPTDTTITDVIDSYLAAQK